VIGTRPEAIKLAPVAHALAARGLGPTLIFTGQHSDLDPHDFALSDFPRLQLRCPGKQDPHAHVRDANAALLPLLRDRPDLLVVQGDTSSALGAALAAFAAGVPVAHVEAGLRTHDPLLPWPEEEYRTAIDEEANLLFAPTQLAAANLHAERVAGEIHITGNTSIDAVLAVEAGLPPASLRNGSAPRVLVTCHRRESWGEGLESIAAALLELGEDGAAAIDLVLHPNPHVAATMRTMLAPARNVALIDPCSHLELVRRMRDADLILSDSGGIQEEAPALGTPLLVLREKTERPEGIATGNMRLVGTRADRIVTEARRLLDDPIAHAAMSRRAFPYGDGHAAPRIAALIEEWLERRSAKERQLA
jgi:UDP-N-acetylglucosamine 2-epimerase (non-hydrolysing)